MHYCLGLLITCALLSSSFCYAQNKSPEPRSLSFTATFADYPEGCIVVFDLKNDHWVQHNAERCRRRFIPASTFKIMHALIALETGVIDGPSHRITWDGRKRRINAWNRDHDLKSAISHSVVWYFEAVASSIPPRQMQEWLAACNYGNHKTSGIAPFWLSGDLAISPAEQVSFLRKLYAGELPLQAVVMDTVRQLILLEKTGDWALYGKTGWAQAAGINIGWFVGWVETRDNVFFFATNLQSARTKGFGAARKAITLDVLQQIGAMTREVP